MAYPDPLAFPAMNPALKAVYLDHVRLLSEKGLWLSNTERMRLCEVDTWTNEDSYRVWRRIRDCEIKARKVMRGERVPDYLKAPNLNTLIPEPFKSKFEEDPNAWSPSKLPATLEEEDLAHEIADVLVPSLEEALKKTEEELHAMDDA